MGDSWSKQISSGDVAILDEYAADIERYMSVAANQFINIGITLNIARQMFPGDKEFGKWRAERTPINSASTANKYMAVARKFASKKIVGKVSYSVLKELLPASEKVVAEVEAKADAGKLVTKAEVRKKVIEERPKKQVEECRGEAADLGDRGEAADSQVSVLSLDVHSCLCDRMNNVKGDPIDTLRAWYVFGMEVPEELPNVAVVAILFDAYVKIVDETCSDNRQMLDIVYSAIMECY